MDKKQIDARPMKEAQERIEKTLYEATKKRLRIWKRSHDEFGFRSKRGVQPKLDKMRGKSYDMIVIDDPCPEDA